MWNMFELQNLYLKDFLYEADRVTAILMHTSDFVYEYVFTQGQMLE